MKKNDGGQAFPTDAGQDYDPKKYMFSQRGYNSGMSLRDYFAAAALQGILAANRNLPGMNRENVDQMMAEEAYRSADAMIIEREK